jgi:hypothetical protein
VGQNHARCQNCAIPHRCFTSARRLVAMAGVEPARPKTPGLESGASPCFTTWPLSLLLRRDLCQLGYSARCVLRLGIEPRTCGLRGRRSAAELPERGADDGSRTRNNQLGGLVPDQLGLIRRYCIVGPGELDSPTSRVSTRRSYRLSYSPVELAAAGDSRPRGFCQPASGRPGSNWRPPGPRPGARPTALRPVVTGRADRIRTDDPLTPSEVR